MKQPWTSAQLRQRIREIVEREIAPREASPGEETDLVRSGLLDSMGWIAVLTAIEEITRIANFGNPWPEGRPQTFRALVKAAEEGILAIHVRKNTEGRELAGELTGCPVGIAGWGRAAGSIKIDASEIEKNCGLPPGTILRGAGIESVHIGSENEDHLSLARAAADAALETAQVEPGEVDVLIGVSATFLALPSFGAALHTRLLLPELCAVLDTGGACVGLLNALKVASAMLASQGKGTALVVASEVHSRLLASLHAPGELRGLFGDGACAFVLTAGPARKEMWLTLGSFTFGCSGGLSSALEIRLTPRADFEFQFNGEQLGRAAVDLLLRTIGELERLSGRARSEVAAFAIHEANPRLARIFAQNSRIPSGKIQQITRAYGNLGSATCGVSLCGALDALQEEPPASRPLIFVAAVGPGLLWAGTYLH